MALLLIGSVHIDLGKQFFSLESICDTRFSLTSPTRLKWNFSFFGNTKWLALKRSSLIHSTSIQTVLGSCVTEGLANETNSLLQENTALFHVIIYEQDFTGCHQILVHK